MKPLHSFTAAVLALLIVVNAVFVVRYVANTDFSWPDIKFEDYSNHGAKPQIGASLTISNGTASYTYTLSVPEGSTAADLLQRADGQYGLSLQTKTFGDAGLFVDGMMGKSGDTKTNTYWIYYINGKSATVGISQYKLQNGDKISFKYEKSAF